MPSDLTPLTLRFPPADWQWLQAEARRRAVAENRTVTASDLLREAVAEYRAKHSLPVCPHVTTMRGPDGLDMDTFAQHVRECATCRAILAGLMPGM